jgi:hypothetical protein
MRRSQTEEILDVVEIDVYPVAGCGRVVSKLQDTLDCAALLVAVFAGQPVGSVPHGVQKVWDRWQAGFGAKPGAENINIVVVLASSLPDDDGRRAHARS